jgi:hypothetical protein
MVRKFFGALLSNKIAIINIIIIIPLIFLVQSFFHFHPFVMNKMKYILSNIHKFLSPSIIYNITPYEDIDIKRMSISFNISYNDTLKAFLIMKEHEHLLLFPQILDYLRQIFYSAFRNPFDASGLIIIALFINIIILYINYKL